MEIPSHPHWFNFRSLSHSPYTFSVNAFVSRLVLISSTAWSSRMLTIIEIVSRFFFLVASGNRNCKVSWWGWCLVNHEFRTIKSALLNLKRVCLVVQDSNMTKITITQPIESYSIHVVPTPDIICSSFFVYWDLLNPNKLLNWIELN